VAEEGGDAAAAVTAATRLVELDPLDEPARRRLMAALARGGDRAGAIRQYRATVALLERELGVAPLAETTELYESIRDDRFGPAPGPETASVVTAGVPASGEPQARLPMMGRRRELAAVRDALRASSGDGRVASVTGEAGIGKSRLVETLLTVAAADGAAVLAARAFPAEGSIAYAPIVGLLRTGLAQAGADRRLADVAPAMLAEVERLVPLPVGVAAAVAPAGPADSPAARARLLEAIATVLGALASGPVPGVIAVEDLHWADDASREALLYLARRLAARPMLLLLTWRPEDLEAGTTVFADAVEGLPDVTSVRLERLDDVVVGALVDAAAAAGLPSWDAAALAAESEGLPLYVAEALMAGPGADGHAPPRGVRALLRERLASVTQTAGQVLAAAAVIGRSFEFATVRAASGRAEDETVTALEELVRRGILRELASGGEPAFDFGHARLRDAAYEGIGLSRRRLLHRRVAEVLRVDAGRDDPGRLAQIAGHEQAAGRDAAAAEAYLEAGLGSRRVYANREALEHLETALALGHPDVAGLQVAIGEVRTALGDYAGAVAALEAAAGVVSEGSLPAIELRLGQVQARRGDVATAASHLDAALLGADEHLRPAVLVERGAVALRAGELDRAASLANEALDTARSNDARTTGAAHRLLGLVALRRGELDAARTALRQAVAAADRSATAAPGASIAARNGLALVESAAGDHDAAISLLEDALAECQRTGETHLEAAVENNLADQLHAAGRTDEAMAHLKRAVTLFADVGGRPGELEPEIWKLVSW
jgi:tetratricopeptide (TPR) repeat protein